jgi:hypothetical protein
MELALSVKLLKLFLHDAQFLLKPVSVLLQVAPVSCPALAHAKASRTRPLDEAKEGCLKVKFRMSSVHGGHLQLGGACILHLLFWSV